MPTRTIPRAFAHLSLLSLFLTACGGGGGGGGGGGESPDTCQPSNIAGKPDLLQTPSFTAGAVTAGSAVTVNLPVDADTRFVTVTLMSPDRTNYAGGANHTVASPGEQTLSVEITTSPGTVSGDYFPLINLCTDLNACAGSGTGVGIAYSNDQQTPPGPNYVRTRYYDNGTVEGDFATTCMPVPHITVN